MGKARQENKDQRIALPIASFRGMFKAAFASGRQTRLKYGSRLDDLQANLKSGVQPDLIELAKGKMPHDDQ